MNVKRLLRHLGLFRPALAVGKPMTTVSSAAPQPAEPPAAVSTWVPPGHFYSPIVDTKKLKARADIVFDLDAPVPDVDMNDAGQIALFHKLVAYYPDLALDDYAPGGARRYDPANPNFPLGDAIVLAAMIRHFQPGHFFEVGSGYSSCVTLDVNERFFNNAIKCTFLEPYPQLLESLIKSSDLEQVRIIPKPIQDVATATFSELKAGDILFIDSTHVGKTDSDVLHHLFRILPSLVDGVIIHFHDIFWPFEYHRAWLFEENRSWNEQYLLRAFLMHNSHYKVLFFNSWFARMHGVLAAKLMPGFMSDSGGSFWMQKVGGAATGQDDPVALRESKIEEQSTWLDERPF